MQPQLDSQSFASLQRLVWRYFSAHGRSFPWRETVDPYHILVSEFMLQQTQAERVVEKYQAFIQAFPHVSSLAAAPLSKVLRLWVGLGYNRRARYLHETANILMETFDGAIPQTTTELQSLPGIGPYTAAAIQAFGYNLPVVVIETNIRSVFLYYYFAHRTNITDAELKPYVEQALVRERAREWYNALMDYGSYLKKIGNNPSVGSRHYVKQSPFAGSIRQIRGAIISMLATQGEIKVGELIEVLVERLKVDETLITRAISQLVLDRLIVEHNHLMSLAK